MSQDDNLTDLEKARARDYLTELVEGWPPLSAEARRDLAFMLAPSIAPSPPESATVARYKMRRVEVESGETFVGRAPGMSRIRIPESIVRDQLARQIGGVIEARLPWGRADVLTRTAVYEVEPLASYRVGIRQVLAYSAQAEVQPALALFGRASRDKVLKIYLELRDKKPRIDLWWHDGWQWRHISSRAKCITMHDPLPRSAST